MPIPAATFDYDAALRACARGEQLALQQLYQQESRYLLGVALRIVRQRALAEDVLHDAFLSIWRRAGSFDATRGSGKGWIYVVVRHQALNLMRARAHEIAADEDTVETLLQQRQEHDTGETYALQAGMGKLHDCLGHLEPSRRNAIVFAYVDGCSHSEIAQRLQAPLGTVKAWVKRGLAALRECMG
ncbi:MULTISPECIES: sigma-70 family RNA polymerase sigma factor [unclassified Janthinobacterium]|uniref:sigma-70 family RNA polymerase sigma factor n=1 Tax=unclassified Janthinobacterium TaxID=2610881 RepID=UPI001611C4D7|nr:MULTISPECIES: sigma-70 family RNA polymerase sigma factor [unclassified Janthinobacterium]MBB5608396.1 RNA polymerase sigma-70 factor (ECF subfamily) [Janthinobacterium sp. S3T4]MBB5613638.1 RNA polymerase sigma-70 factor (ECF subfamily) [Janthinobacterium sp. S3M3]